MSVDESTVVGVLHGGLSCYREPERIVADRLAPRRECRSYQQRGDCQRARLIERHLGDSLQEGDVEAKVWQRCGVGRGTGLDEKCQSTYK